MTNFESRFGPTRLFCPTSRDTHAGRIVRVRLLSAFSGRLTCHKKIAEVPESQYMAYLDFRERRPESPSLSNPALRSISRSCCTKVLQPRKSLPKKHLPKSRF